MTYEKELEQKIEELEKELVYNREIIDALTIPHLTYKEFVGTLIKAVTNFDKSPILDDGFMELDMGTALEKLTEHINKTIKCNDINEMYLDAMDKVSNMSSQEREDILVEAAEIKKEHEEEVRKENYYDPEWDG